MMRGTAVFFVVFVVLLSLVGQSHGQSLPENRISEIEVRGIVHAPEQEVRDVLSVQIGDDITRRETELKIRRDIASIIDLRQFKNVNVAQEDISTGKRLVYQVFEYPILVGAEFEGNKRLRKSYLRGEIMPEKKRMVFITPDKIDDLAEELKKVYQKKGFSDVTITQSLEVSGENEGTVTFTIAEGPKTKLVDVDIDGNFVFTEKQLLKSIKSRPSWLFFTRRYDKAQLDIDMAIIEQMYCDRGYLDVEVSAEPPKLSPYKKGGLSLNINIDEGDQYYVSDIDITGNTIFGKSELLNAMETDRGDILNQTQFYQDMETLRDMYRDQGYLLVQINPEINKDEQNDTVDIGFNFSEGNIIYLGDVVIEGVVYFEDGTREIVPLKTKDYVVLREIRFKRNERIEWKRVDTDPAEYTPANPPVTELEEPFVLDWGQVKESQRRLINLGFFKKDRIDFQPVLTADPDVMDLMLKLEEQHTGNIAFGAGFSTEYGASLFFSLSEKNLFGTGRAFDFSGEIGSRRQSYKISLTDPYFRNTDYSVGIDLYNTTIEKFSSRDFEEHRRGGALRVGKKFWEHYAWYLRLKHETVDLSEVLNQEKIVTSVKPPEYDDLSSQVNSLTLTLVKDTRDFLQGPTKGYRNSISLEQAGFGGDPFTKVKAESSYYKKLTDKLVLALNGEAGAILGDDVPLSERFFLGGAETVRGYEYGTISPVDFITYWRDDHGLYLDREDVRVGGSEMLLLKTELRYPLTQAIEGVAFFDSGGTWREMGDFDAGEIRYGTGLGLRVTLPIGAMIRLDYGHALNPDEYQETQPIHFSFGHSF